MDISDFEGNQKYKFVVPSLYIINWALIFIGPIFFPVEYQYYCFAIWMLAALKVVYVNFNLVVVFKRTYETLQGKKEIMDSEQETLSMVTNLIQCFIIPSYKEDPVLLGQTLQWIASHPRAQTNYMIMLAMEKHEQGSDVKAQQLKEKYGHCFRIMDYTRHEIKLHEQKGKASNVSWCGEHLEETFAKYSIDPNNVLITIIDADSWVPPLYIAKVEDYLVEHPQSKDLAIFVPPQIFTRNYLDVPVFTRVYDNLHSLAQLSNMRSCLNLIFPISNYSISYNLIKRIGFWDTCQDAIGEDFHTNQKAFWKTNGEAFNVPIYVPFNQVNVQTGEGYIQDVEARFWQAERHAQGCADVAYNLQMIQKTKLVTLKSLTMVYYILECFCLPALVPWVGISSFLQNNIFFYLWEAPPGIIPVDIMVWLINITTLLTFVFYGFFQVFKRYTNPRLFNKQNDSLWRLLEYPIATSLNIAVIVVPTFVIAAFRVLLKKREYRVAEKKMTK